MHRDQHLGKSFAWSSCKRYTKWKNVTFRLYSEKSSLVFQIATFQKCTSYAVLTSYDNLVLFFGTWVLNLFQFRKVSNEDTLLLESSSPFVAIVTRMVFSAVSNFFAIVLFDAHILCKKFFSFNSIVFFQSQTTKCLIFFAAFVIRKKKYSLRHVVLFLPYKKAVCLSEKK